MGVLLPVLSCCFSVGRKKKKACSNKLKQSVTHRKYSEFLVAAFISQDSISENA